MSMMSKLKEDYKREKELYEAKEQEKRAKKEAKGTPTEQEKLAKTVNTVAKGVSFWFLLPVFLVVAVIGVFVLFWIWDMITGLF